MATLNDILDKTNLLLANLKRLNGDAIVADTKEILSRMAIVKKENKDDTKKLAQLQLAYKELASKFARCEQFWAPAKGIKAVIETFQRLAYTVLLVVDNHPDIKMGLTTNEKATLTTFKDISPLIEKWLTDTTSIINVDDPDLLLRGQRLLEQLTPLKSTIVNLYEDQFGNVRVYVRTKQETSKYIENIDHLGQYIVWKDKRFGPFFHTFGSTDTNADIYYNDSVRDASVQCSMEKLGICRVARQLQLGYHLIMVATGISGSEKEWSLFGTEKEDGLAGLTMRDMVNVLGQVGESAELISVFELVQRQSNLTEARGNAGMVVNLYRANDVLDLQRRATSPEIVMDSEFQLDDIIKTNGLDPNNLSSDHIIKLQKLIDDVRKKDGRVTNTPLSQHSTTRTHLFITLQIGEGILTLVDTASSESPNTILQSYLSKPFNAKWPIKELFLSIPTMPTFITDLKTGLPPTVSRLKVLSQLVRDCLFIHLSLADMAYFFGVRERVIAKFPISDIDAFPSFARLQRQVDTNTDNIGMFTILAQLVNFEKRRARVLILQCIKDDKRFHQDTLASLRFAQSITQQAQQQNHLPRFVT